MGLYDLVKLFASTKVGTYKVKEEDFSDRLSNEHTVLLMVCFATLLGIGLLTDPITCFKPQHLTKNHYKYVKSYCWVKNTYYLPFEDEIPKEHDEYRPEHITYYQWLPLILMAQAIFFFLPSRVWNSLNQSGGVDADHILAAAATLNQVDSNSNFEKRRHVIANLINKFLGNKLSIKMYKDKDRAIPGRPGGEEKGAKSKMLDRWLYTNRISKSRFGCYLVVLYLITKCLYLTNVIAQLFILNSILSVQYSVYGIEVLGWMLHDYDWTNSPQVAFPRVTMCDFKVRRLGNIHRYTVQCTLPINLYTEKIYMFLWFWMVFVATCTAISLVTWLGRVFSVNDRITYVKNHLKMIEKPKKEADIVHSHEQDPEEREKKINRFVRNYLRQDGVFLLRLIGHNTNTITVTEIIGALWENWSENDKNKKQKEIEDDDNKKTSDPLLPK